MKAAFALLAIAVHGSAVQAVASCVAGMPCYTAASVVNSASNKASEIAPNTLVTIYGTYLAFDTGANAAVAGAYPREIKGVRVDTGGWTAPLVYVSPTQVNFLMPDILTGKEIAVSVIRQGASGPRVTVPLRSAAPAFFESAGAPVAVHGDGSLVSASQPVKPGEVIVLYATGLGVSTDFQLYDYWKIPDRAAWIRNRANLRISLDDRDMSFDDILYAGVTPGFGGLYQINLRIPEGVSGEPVIRVAVAADVSSSSLRLPMAKPPAE